MQVLKPYDRKLAKKLEYKTIASLKRYHQYKKITKMQNSEYAEDTSRYYYALRWYEVIRGTLEEWRKFFPEDAKVVALIFGLGDYVRAESVTKAAMECNYSESTVYKIRKDFVMEVSYKAVKEGLLPF